MLFNNLTSEGLEKTEDRIGGGSRVLETNIYDGKVKVAYAGKSSNSDAQNVTVIYDFDGKEYSETYWVTNAKGENFFRNKDDNTKKVPLPGYTMVNDLCLVTTGQPLAMQPTEEKILSIYDFNERKEMPKSVQVLDDLTGKEVSVAIIKQIVNKNQKNDSTGQYEPIADTREENVSDKMFHVPTKLTVVEAENGKEAGEFYDVWKEKNAGNTRDKRTIKDGQAAPQGGKAGRPGAGGAPQSSSQSGAPKTSSLFGKG